MDAKRSEVYVESLSALTLATSDMQRALTFYESLYDREHIPQVVNSITGGDDDTDPEFNVDDYDDYSGDAFYLQYITNSTDAEIAAMDTSVAESPLWDEAKSFVRF